MGEGRPHPMIAELRAQLAAGALGRRAFLRLATLLGVSVAAARSMAGDAACAADAPQPQRSGGRLVLGERVHPLGDPHALSWLAPANVVHQVCEPLTRTGFDNITRPHLLSGWKVSPDLRSWDLFLREDVRWHSGRRFVADDVAWNLQRILDPATGSSALGLMRDYMLAEGISPAAKGGGLWDAAALEKRGDFHLRLNLRKPQVAVPEHLFHFTNVMLDPEEGGSFGVGSNGTGPFQLVDYRVGERALLRKAEAPRQGWPEAQLDELLLIDLGGDPMAAAAAVVSGQVHGLTRCDYSVADLLAKRPGFRIHRSRTSATGLLQMRVDTPPFDDPRVRRAMRLAIDVEAVTRTALRGYGEPAEHHMVAPVHPCYAKLPPMGYHPEEARALLAEAGHADGLDLTITCKNSPEWELGTVQAMAAQYEAVGIRCALEVLPAARFWEIWDKAPLAFVEWAPRPLGFMLLDLAVRSGVPWNTTAFSDPQIDDLLSDVQTLLDIEARRPVMRDIERRMQEIGPVVQPSWLSVVTVMSERVGGFRLHPTTLLFAEDYFLHS